MCILRWLLWGVVLLAPLPAAAIQTGTLGAFPTDRATSTTPWFQYHLGGGGQLSDSLTVKNRSNQPLDVAVYPVDAAPIANGGFGMAPHLATTHDAGGWIKLDTSSLHLLPQSEQTVGFRFKVPDHPSVGPHYGGIVIQPLQSSTEKREGLSVQIISRVGVRLYETVPGIQRPSLAISVDRHFRNNRHLFTIPVRNSGNTILVPSGQLQVKNIFGRTVEQLPLSTGHSLTPNQNGRIVTSTMLPSWGLPMRYRATAVFKYGTTQHPSSVTQSLVFWTGFNWAWIAAIALLLLAAFAIKFKRKKNGKR